MKRPPAGIEVIATLYSLIYFALLSATLVHGLWYERWIVIRNVAAVAMILVLIFLSRGYGWASWVFLVAQGVQVATAVFFQLTHPQALVSAVIGRTAGIATAIFVMSYLCMPHVREWFREEETRRSEGTAKT